MNALHHMPNQSAFYDPKNQDSQVRGTNILAIVDIVKKPKNKSKIQINSSDILRNCF